MMKSIGADKVIDYTKEDFNKNGEVYYVIYDVVGKSSFSDIKRSLKKKVSIIYPTLGFHIFFEVNDLQ